MILVTQSTHSLGMAARTQHPTDRCNPAWEAKAIHLKRYTASLFPALSSYHLLSRNLGSSLNPKENIQITRIFARISRSRLLGNRRLRHTAFWLTEGNFFLKNVRAHTLGETDQRCHLIASRKGTLEQSSTKPCAIPVMPPVG